MSCADITVTIDSSPDITVTVNSDSGIVVNIDGESSGVTMLDQTNHTISDASTLTYLLKNGQAFKTNSLLVFRNGILQKKDLHYSENATLTGITFLITLDDESGDEDDIQMYYAVA